MRPEGRKRRARKEWARERITSRKRKTRRNEAALGSIAKGRVWLKRVAGRRMHAQSCCNYLNEPPAVPRKEQREKEAGYLHLGRRLAGAGSIGVGGEDEAAVHWRHLRRPFRAMAASVPHRDSSLLPPRFSLPLSPAE